MKLSTFFILGLLTAGVVFFSCTGEPEQRKIRLSSESIGQDDDQISSAIHLEPSTRRAVAVMFFNNNTGDYNGIAGKLKSGDTALMLVKRGGTTIYIAVKLK